MAELCSLRSQIRFRVPWDSRLAGDALDDANPEAFELPHFVRVIRQQAHAPDAQRAQSFGRKAVVARVGGEAELLVGFHGVHAAVLQFIGAELVHQADPAPFLGQIEQNTAAGLGNLPQGEFELCAAVAAQGRKHVAREALRMHANQGNCASPDAAVNEGDGLILSGSLEAVECEAAEARREIGAGDGTHAAAARRFAAFCG